MTDLISRQAVLMSLADYQLQESPNWGANGMGNTDAYEAITECIRVIEQAPTIDPVKHGKWLKEQNCWFICSNCGHLYATILGQLNHKYCPNCGSFMENGGLT